MIAIGETGCAPLGMVNIHNRVGSGHNGAIFKTNGARITAVGVVAGVGEYVLMGQIEIISAIMTDYGSHSERIGTETVGYYHFTVRQGGNASWGRPLEAGVDYPTVNLDIF